MKWNERAPERHSQFRQLIVHARWDTREESAGYDPVRFQPLQGQRQHSLGDTAHAPLDFVVAQLPFRKRAHDQDGPLVADAHQNFGKSFAVCGTKRFRRNKFVRFAQESAFL